MEKGFTPLEVLNKTNKLRKCRRCFLSLTGFTLIELVIVIVIIGVLVTLGFSQYYPLRERAFDREAEANLRLILAAERIWRMEDNNNDYYASTGANPVGHIQNINTNLRLSLSAAANRNWNYRAWANNTSVPKTCCAQATRNGSGGRTWRLRNTEDDPVAGGTCP